MTTQDQTKYLQLRVRRPASAWPVLRLVSVGLSIALCILLLRRPHTGLTIFWSFVVPILPLVFLVAPGLWRNVCPMAAINQAPRVLGLTRAIRLPDWLERHSFGLASLLFFGIAGSRLVGLNDSSQALTIVLVTALVLPLLGGLVYRGKSGWCGSLCPLRAIQSVYAQAPVAHVENSHCRPCVGCMSNCPDLKPDTHFADSLHEENEERGHYRRLFAGALPGFVLAFSTAPDAPGLGPLAVRLGLFMLASVGLFVVVEALVRVRVERVTALFAAMAFGSFYWFNVPMVARGLDQLFGVSVPSWAIWEGRGAMILLATGWLAYSARQARVAAGAEDDETAEIPLPMATVEVAEDDETGEESLDDDGMLETVQVAARRRPMAGDPPVPVPDRRSRSRRMRHPEVTFVPGGRRLEVERGTTLLEAAQKAGLKLEKGCGIGICGCDPIYVFSGMESLSPPAEEERATIERLGLPEHTRMACSARVLSDTVVSLQADVGGELEPAVAGAPAEAQNGDAPDQERAPAVAVPSSVERIVILGNGIAGVTAADHLRRHHSDCHIDLVTDEAHPFYNRTSVSRLIGSRSAMKRMYLLPDSWYDERRITSWLNTRAVKIDRHAQKVELGTGESLAYDRLILATGSRPLLPPISGFGIEGTFSLRRADDAILIRSFVQEHDALRAVVAGGGVLGLEAADILRQLGLKVTVVELADRLAAVQLDRRGAELLQEHVEDAGIEVVLGTQVEAVTGAGRMSSVELDDGSERKADLLIVCAGVTPNADLARDAELHVRRGVVVDDRMRTSDPAIFAAGDVAEHNGRVYGLWPAAVEQAEVAAINSLGGSVTYRGSTVPTRLKLTGVDVVSIGEPIVDGPGADEIALEDPVRGRYRKLAVLDHEIVGAVLLDHPAEATAVTAAIKDRRDISGDVDLLRTGDWDVLNESAFEQAVVAPLSRHDNGNGRAGGELRKAGSPKRAAG
jgi:NADPH-dependent 2,4-dienoyl-CoA reductase/sulfur reductase-like enzyme/ferredoxin